MARDRWESQRKTARNEALYRYAEEHPQATFEEIGMRFNISKQRAHEIYKIQEAKNQAAVHSAA